MLVDELQAGLADGDIYLSVYLKEVWFKSFSFRFVLFICVPGACVCVSVCVRMCVCVKGEHTSSTVLTVSGQAARAASSLLQVCQSALKAQRKIKGGG